MKVCLIGINFYPEVTGCGPFTTDLAIEISSLGHDVTVITGLPHYPMWKTDSSHKKISSSGVIDGVSTIKRVNHYVPKKQGLLNRARYELSFYRGVRRVKIVKDFDIVIAVVPTLLSSFLAHKFKKEHGQTKILIQDIMSLAAPQSGMTRSKITSRIIRQLEFMSFRKFDSIGVICREFKDYCSSLGIQEDKIVITENYSTKEIKVIDQNEARNQLGFELNDFIIMHTGNMGLKQDLGNVIKAAQLSMDPSIHFHFIGDGSQKDSLVQMSSGMKNVHFRDLVQDEVYSLLLSCADVLLVNELPTVQNMSLPSKLQNYLKTDKGILVACAIGGSTYSVVMDQNLVHVQPGNPEALLSAVLRLKKDKHFKGERRFDDSGVRERRLEWALSNE